MDNNNNGNILIETKKFSEIYFNSHSSVNNDQNVSIRIEERDGRRNNTQFR